MILPLVLLVLLVVALLYFARSNELFSIRVRGGRLHLERGYAPPALLADFGDVLRGVERAEIRAVKLNQRAELRCRGDIDDVVTQRLRNVLGMYPIARLRARRR